MNLNHKILAIIIALFPITLFAQKITLGSCTTKDNGEYKGEMLSGKPNGKGTTVYKNGDRFEGEYVKGKRQG